MYQKLVQRKMYYSDSGIPRVSLLRTYQTNSRATLGDSQKSVVAVNVELVLI
jgi:hypothetical protein